jgi:hypothetical protein
MVTGLVSCHCSVLVCKLFGTRGADADVFECSDSDVFCGVRTPGVFYNILAIGNTIRYIRIDVLDTVLVHNCIHAEVRTVSEHCQNLPDKARTIVDTSKNVVRRTNRGRTNAGRDRFSACDVK